jgi:hypothetical protein
MKFTQRHYRFYPELELFPDDETRITILKQLQRGMIRTRRFWLACVGHGIATTAVVAVSPSILGLVVFGSYPGWLVSFIPAMVLGIGFGFGLQFLWRKPVQKRLREELVSRGIPICIPCGYDLRGQIEPRCPECGRGFDPRLITGIAEQEPPGRPPDMPG